MTAEKNNFDQSGTYTFSVDLAAVEHLGLNLYSNTAAALTELIANAWDADATKVDITIDTQNNKIIIIDNGHGMSIEDINNKFLTVGYKRRNSNPITPLGRPVMGRKGIGKLALFSIAEHINITSKQEGLSENSLAIDINELKEHIVQKTPYHPNAITQEPFPQENGTRFILTNLLTSRLKQSSAATKKRIARRFSVIGAKDNFIVSINKEPIEHHDRDDFRNLQFAWKFSNDSQISFPQDVKVFDFSNNLINHEGETYFFSGWLGTALKPKDLNSEDMGNLNGISIISRGRIFQENILDKISENRLVKSYITGTIEADFLDSDNLEDLATSDRQRVREDDPRYIALIRFIKEKLNEIYNTWSFERKKYDVQVVTTDYPKLKEWFSSLNDGHRKQAEELIATVSNLKMDEKSEDDRKKIYRSTILAFERLKLEGSSHELVNAVNQGPDELMGLLSNFDNYEISLYLDLVRNRMNTINVIENKVLENEYENKIRDFIYDHLWLIDPSWERVVSSEIKETAIHKQFQSEIKDVLNDEERSGRVDLSYRNIGDDHIIIELKRPKLTYTLDKYQLHKQGQKYRDALFKCINKVNPNFINKEKIKIVFLIGERLKNEDPLEIEKFFNSLNARVSTYDEMLLKAKAAYADFITKSKEADKIRELVESFS